MEHDLHPAVLDLPTVGRLRGIAGRSGSLFDDLAPVFVATTSAQLARLELLLAVGDLEAAAGVARQLADACGSFGAVRMAAAVSSLRTQPPSAAQRDGPIDRLRRELDAVVAHLPTGHVEPAA